MVIYSYQYISKDMISDRKINKDHGSSKIECKFLLRYLIFFNIVNTKSSEFLICLKNPN